MTETEFYFYDVIALIFIVGGLYAYLCYQKKVNSLKAKLKQMI